MRSGDQIIAVDGVSVEESNIYDIVGRMRGRPALYASHIRNEGPGLVDAVDEALAIGAEGGVAVHVSHLKCAGRAAWGRMEEALGRLRAARAAGRRVSQDVYPYTASSTMLVVCLPRALRGLPNPEILRRLRAPDAAGAVREGLRQDGDDQRPFDAVDIAWTPDHRYEGRTLAAIADALGTDGAEALVRVLVEEDLRAMMVSHSMREEDLETALRDPFTAIGSDGAPPGLGGRPHPRLWGTFPRILGRYARERAVLPLAEAVRRMTSLPADVFRLREVGRLAAGLRADVVAFDPAAVADLATYEAPTRPAAGIRHVLVGGAWALRDGRPAGARPGVRLRPAP
jgi:dihydroorotase/N-acyl-D-amino-acid deacylase